MSTAAADRLGISDLSRAVMWNPSSRAAMDQALAANGLVSTSIRIRRSWDPPDPDDTLGLSRTKALLGEFAYRVNGDGSVTQDGAWQAANLPGGRVLLNGSIPHPARGATTWSIRRSAPRWPKSPPGGSARRSTSTTPTPPEGATTRDSTASDDE